MKKGWIIMTLLIAGAPASGASNIERSKDFFRKLDKDHLELVDGFYDPNTLFQDPVHELRGSNAVKNYYSGLYQNVTEIHFEFKNAWESESTVTLEWRMHLKASAIQSGKEITVDGASLITFGGPEGKAIRHRDYFDMGEFIYERVPVLKTIIGIIKKKLSGK